MGSAFGGNKSSIANYTNYANLVWDSFQDFSSDFERSDPYNTPPSSEVLERILVRILVEDFYYDNPKLKSLLTYATVVLRIPLGLT